MTRVLIIHSCPIYRRGLRALLTSAAAEIEVVGETIEPEQMVHLVHQYTPDVVLLDEGLAASLPDYTAVQLVSSLRRSGARGIFVLAHSITVMNEEHVFQLLVAGAFAYESATITDEHLLETIALVGQGECLISDSSFQNSVARQEVPKEVVKPVATDAAEAESSPRLSPAELAVLRQVMIGRSNKQIAIALQLSDQTVKNHITSIMKKFNVADRTAAVVDALRHGFLALDDPELMPVPRRQRSAHERTNAMPTLDLAS